MEFAEVEGGVMTSLDLSSSGERMFNEQVVTEFFQSILGQESGQAWMLALGRSNGSGNSIPLKRSFHWPHQMYDMVKFARQSSEGYLDVYVNVGLFQIGTPTIEREHVQSSQCIWIDADSCSPAYLEPEKRFVLETSPNSYQVFWALDQAVSPDQAEDVARRLAYKHKGAGADKCWNANRFMRVPTTRNYKKARVLPDGTSPEVKVLEHNPQAIVSLDFFKSLPDVVESAPMVRTSTSPTGPGEGWKPVPGGESHDYTAATYPDMPAIRAGYGYPGDVKGLWFASPVGDRSNWTYAMVRALCRCGVDDAGITESLMAHPVILDRLKNNSQWNGDEKYLRQDITRVLLKARPTVSHVTLLPREKQEVPLDEEVTTLQIDDRKRVFTVSELVDLPELPWLIKDHLPAKGHINFFGPSGVGKSLVVLDWAMRLSLGKEWNHIPTSPTPVFYVVAEGLLVTKLRVKAWCAFHGYDVRDMNNIFFYGEPVYLMDPGAVGRLMIDMERAKVPGLVIFDTLSQCLSGVNENSPEVMSQINSVLIEMRARYDCSTLVVHHTGYEGDHERGHSSFPAAADTRIKVETCLGQVTVDCEKQRGGEEFSTVYYNKIPHAPSVLVDATDVQATSLTLETLEPYHKKILGALFGQGTLSGHEVQAMVGMTEKRFTRYKAELQKSKLIRPSDNWGKQIALTPEGDTMYRQVTQRIATPKVDLTTDVSKYVRGGLF